MAYIIYAFGNIFNFPIKDTHSNKKDACAYTLKADKPVFEKKLFPFVLNRL